MKDSSSIPDSTPTDDITPRLWYLATPTRRNSFFETPPSSHYLSGIPLKITAVSPPYALFSTPSSPTSWNDGYLYLPEVSLVRCTPQYVRQFMRLVKKKADRNPPRSQKPSLDNLSHLRSILQDLKREPK